MAAKSIKARLTRIIIGIVLLIAIALSSFFLNRLTDSSTWRIKEITRLEKEFFQLVLGEKEVLANKYSQESIHKDYDRFLDSCQTCHGDAKSGALVHRINIFDQLFNVVQSNTIQYSQVHEMIVGLTTSIRAIHDHHITNLQNFKIYDSSNKGRVSHGSVNFSTEQEVIRLAVDLQTIVFDFSHCFLDLRENGSNPSTQNDFARVIEKFLEGVNTFGGYSLPPHESAAVEELNLKGRKLEESFNMLLANEEDKRRLVADLNNNRHSLQESLAQIRDKISQENKRDHNYIRILQGMALLCAVLLVRWIALHGNNIIREARKTVSETKKIQDDISYRIKEDNTEFEEFRIIFNALNSMAQEIEQNLIELRELQKNTEKRVGERTSDLVESNLKLKLEIEERMRIEEEQKDLHAQLRKAQRMEAIGTLAGGIAHDFNNILTAILGFAELAKDELHEDSPIRRDLEQILLSGGRAKDLVKQMLAFSRQVDQERMPMQLQLIVKEIIKLLRASLPTTIDIKQDIVGNCGSILIDPNQIRQLIMNLCTNAAHAMDEHGGTLGIDLCEVDLTADAVPPFPDLMPIKYVKFSVTDTGVGMSPETKERIFDPFFTTKAVNKGTGLGLSVVHGIVESHDGSMYVESEFGKGTSVHVFLPVIEEDIILESHEKTEEDIIGGTERILFVDDEAAIVSLAEKILTRLGYNVKCFTNGIEAFKEFRDAPDNFDLVITDQTMPSITGVELVSEILAVRQDIPIILCTGFSEKISEEKSKEMGISRFALKPILGRELAKMIREVLDEG